MADGTGLDRFAREFPDRFYDVGIAEQHAVTFAAGLATEGMKPVAAIYSTFLQRAYDQIVHDVCLQNLDVTLAMDRAGIVGADGATHQGMYDIAYLRHLPNIICMAPKDENELQQMLRTAIEYDGPAAVRYPRGAGFGVPLDPELKAIPIGESELLRDGDDALIVAYGTLVHPALEAAAELSAEGISAAVLNARFAKPLDRDRILSLASRCRALLTVEEHSGMGGFGSAVLEALSAAGVVVSSRCLAVPDSGDRARQHRRDSPPSPSRRRGNRPGGAGSRQAIRCGGVLKGARLDERVVRDGLAETRTRAQALIRSGRVLVDDVPVEKPGTRVRDEAAVRVRGEDRAFVSRGGEKLAGALEDLGIDPNGFACLDLGASTGGFTDCLLRAGARRVVAVDVGYGQLDVRLRGDPRVLVLERTNARHLEASAVPGPIDLVTIDVSFISATTAPAPPSRGGAWSGHPGDGEAAVRGRPEPGGEGGCRPRRGAASGSRRPGARLRRVPRLSARESGG